MKAPSQAHQSGDETLTSHWTTSKGNKVSLEFDPDNYGGYDIAFNVNDSTTEDITRSSDREILQTLLYQIKKTIDENDIRKFSFEAWYDGMDVKSIAKMLRPYATELTGFIKKYKSDYSIAPFLETILSYFPYSNESHYVNQNIKRINQLLNHPEKDDKLNNFLERLKLLMTRLLDIIDSGEASNYNAPNRRLAIYKRFLSQYLGPEWKIEPKGRNGVFAKKIS